ncbi:MAG: Gfo/Idh/MocA family oxidoreductase [Dehalococcoidia bacterium]|nr:Gfo/Idh/MocA family oxidoreductase [Dehalococcoidia bacterium]
MSKLRIGFIGAGGNTRSRHIPGFLELDDIELAGVANRTRESSQAVADEFAIERVYDSPADLSPTRLSMRSALAPGPIATGITRWPPWRPASTCCARHGWQWTLPRRPRCSTPPNGDPISLPSWCLPHST